MDDRNLKQMERFWINRHETPLMGIFCCLPEPVSPNRLCRLAACCGGGKSLFPPLDERMTAR